MKFLLIALIAFYFTGCEPSFESKKQNYYNQKNATDKTSDNNVETKDDASGAPFTITHKATDSEYVYIYIDTQTKTHFNKEKPHENPNYLYKLEPSECIIVKESQFPNLKVEVGEGWSKSISFACGSSSKCQAGHYEIVNLGAEWFEQNKFILKSVNQPNTSSSCIEIKKWMASKDMPPPQPKVEQTTKEN